MKSLRKSILTLLALTLFGGAGAWAQGPTNVIEITTDMLPASWASDNSDVTLADMQALGFGAVDVSVAQAWTGAPQGEFVVLIFGFNGGNFYYIPYGASGDMGDPSYTGYSKRGLYENVAYSGIKHFFTRAQEIELTKTGANQWTLGQTPDYDLELQVEYYEAHALKDIPAGWTVMVNGVEQQTPYQGDSLMITETDSVTLVPAGNARRVKSVTLEDEVPPAIPLDNTTTAWADGRYAVPEGGLTYSAAITVSGNVTLVLTDGETLTLNKGISLAEGATLTVEGNGTMNINGTTNSTASTVAGTGMLVLTSGTLNAKGGDGGTVADGSTSGGGNAINGAVTVSGGTLTATGGNGGGCNAVPMYDDGWTGGGSGWRGDGAAAISGDVIITAGIVTAKGGNGGSLPNASSAHAGAGGNAINGNVTLSGGTLTKTDGNAGTMGVKVTGSVKAGGKAVAGTTTNNGGTVN